MKQIRLTKKNEGTIKSMRIGWQYNLLTDGKLANLAIEIGLEKLKSLKTKK